MVVPEPLELFEWFDVFEEFEKRPYLTKYNFYYKRYRYNNT